MITFEKQKTGYELVNKIIEKSIENSTFKQELLNNPHAAIESVYIMKSPEDWDRFMRFMERYGQTNGLVFTKAT